jgi:hypothetical protein
LVDAIVEPPAPRRQLQPIPHGDKRIEVANRKPAAATTFHSARSARAKTPTNADNSRKMRRIDRAPASAVARARSPINRHVAAQASPSVSTALPAPIRRDKNARCDGRRNA